MDHSLSGRDVADGLRKIDPEDIAKLKEIYRNYSGRDIAARRVEEAISGYPSVAALRAGEMVGFCYCFRFAPDIVELANIFVARAYRQSGLGSIMLKHLLDQISHPTQAVIAVNS